MKTLVLSMISIAATIAAMTACTSESDPINDITNPKDAKVEIKATAGIGSIDVETKATIDQGSALPGVQFVRSDGETAVWSDVNNINGTGDIAAGTPGSITFNPAQYYPKKGKTSLIGYYPSGTITSGVVSFTINGTQDILCSNIVEADRANIETKPTVSFELKHKLTQLKFKVKAKDTEAIDIWGTITSINLINQKTTAKLTLSSQNLAFETGSTPIAVASGLTQTLTADEAGLDIGDPIMVEPEQTKYTVNVITSKNPEGVDIELTNVAGTVSTAYTVLLTFKGKNIDATGSIGAWTPDSNGTGETD